MQAFPSDPGPQISTVPARSKTLLEVPIDGRHSRSSATSAPPNEPTHSQTRHLKLLLHPGFANTPHSLAHRGRNSKNAQLDFARATPAQFAPPSASRCA